MAITSDLFSAQILYPHTSSHASGREVNFLFMEKIEFTLKKPAPLSSSLPKTQLHRYPSLLPDSKDENPPTPPSIPPMIILVQALLLWLCYWSDFSLPPKHLSHSSLCLFQRHLFYVYWHLFLSIQTLKFSLCMLQMFPNSSLCSLKVRIWEINLQCSSVKRQAV